MKKYKLIDNIELWGAEAQYGMIIEEDELLRLAGEWDKDVDELMADLEEVDEDGEGDEAMKLQFEASDNGNILWGENDKLYVCAEITVPDGASDDYGYMTLKEAILKAVDGKEELSFWYDGQEKYLAADAFVDEQVSVDLEWKEDDDADDFDEIAEHYDVFWIGGEKDGETIATFATEREAVAFAKAYQRDHENEFDPCWGGVGITDQEGNDIEW